MKSKKMEEYINSTSFFDSEKYPIIVFKSNTLIPKKNGIFSINGQLTIKGITKIITLPITVNENILTSNFTINRTHFKVGKPLLVLGNNVMVNFKISL